MKKAFVSIVIIFLLGIGFTPNICRAVEEDMGANPGDSELDALLGDLPSGSAGVTTNGVTLGDPLNLGDNPIPKLANRFITAALGISGVLAIIAFIYGGILYLTSGVNPKYVEKGKEVMKYAVIGLVVIFSSYAVITFLLKTVLQVAG